MSNRKEYMKEFMRRKRANKQLTNPVSMLADVSIPVSNLLAVKPCQSCIKLQCQLDDALAEIDRLNKPKPIKTLLSNKSSDNTLPFSKARQARGIL